MEGYGSREPPIFSRKKIGGRIHLVDRLTYSEAATTKLYRPFGDMAEVFADQFCWNRTSGSGENVGIPQKFPKTLGSNISRNVVDTTTKFFVMIAGDILYDQNFFSFCSLIGVGTVTSQTFAKKFGGKSAAHL